MKLGNTRLHYQLAAGEHPDPVVHEGRPTGYKRGGHVSKHKVPHAGHHNMDGNIHEKDHHHSHKTHGHHVGVHHHASGGVIDESGSAHDRQSPAKGPSDTQFGSKEPHGGTIGRW